MRRARDRGVNKFYSYLFPNLISSSSRLFSVLFLPSLPPPISSSSSSTRSIPPLSSVSGRAEAEAASRRGAAGPLRGGVEAASRRGSRAAADPEGKRPAAAGSEGGGSRVVASCGGLRPARQQVVEAALPWNFFFFFFLFFLNVRFALC
jgi:hypothetical protein